MLKFTGKDFDLGWEYDHEEVAAQAQLKFDAWIRDNVKVLELVEPCKHPLNELIFTYLNTADKILVLKCESCKAKLKPTSYEEVK
jgi:hypothetical protein